MFCRGYGTGLHRTHNTMKNNGFIGNFKHSCNFTAVLILLQGFGEKVNPGTEGTTEKEEVTTEAPSQHLVARCFIYS